VTAIVTEHRKKSRETTRYSFVLSYTPSEPQNDASPRRKLTESLEFTSVDQQLHSFWLDGLSFLLDKPIVGESRKIIEMIADLGVKVRLMDFATYECKIPEEGGDIPEEIDNYEFVFDEKELYGAYEMGDEEGRNCEQLVVDVCFE
jgi:hypothetical protein